MVAERDRDRPTGRRPWTYGLVDLLVVASCSLVFLAVVAGSKGTPRRPAVEDRSRDLGALSRPLHHPVVHDAAGGDTAPWTPTRPR